MRNYTGWEIPEGKVVKVEDASGRVIWALQSDKPVVLQVEKITSDTYAAETTYKSEQFILLDIYHKTNGAVKVTYGGLTKTIVDTSGAEEPNAQQVYFGTFNGVSDEVETPASGTLTIEGDFYAFGNGSYNTYNSKNKPVYAAGCITAVTEIGEIEVIPNYAFYKDLGTYSYPSSPDDSNFVDEIILPATLTSIGEAAMAIKWVSNNVGQTATNYQCMAKKVRVLAETPPTLSTGIYPLGKYDEGVPIIVNPGLGDVYTAAEGWSNYKKRITEVSE